MSSPSESKLRHLLKLLGACLLAFVACLLALVVRLLVLGIRTFALILSLCILFVALLPLLIPIDPIWSFLEPAAAGIRSSLEPAAAEIRSSLESATAPILPFLKWSIAAIPPFLESVTHPIPSFLEWAAAGIPPFLDWAGARIPPFLQSAADGIRSFVGSAADGIRSFVGWAGTGFLSFVGWAGAGFLSFVGWLVAGILFLLESAADPIRSFLKSAVDPIRSSIKTIIVAATAIGVYMVHKSLDSLNRTSKEWRKAFMEQFMDILAMIFGTFLLKDRRASRNNQSKHIWEKYGGSLVGSSLRFGARLFIPSVTFFAVFSYHLLVDNPQSKSGKRPERGESSEPIIGLPVLFGRAQGGTPSKDSRGIKLEDSHEVQLKIFIDLLKPILNSKSNSIELLVIGYASHTLVDVNGSKEFEPNRCIANLRAKTVGDYLKNDLGVNCSRMEWDKYKTLETCRPYRNPNGLSDDATPLGRFNQSVMLYVMKHKKADIDCFRGGDFLKECGGSDPVEGCGE